MSFANVLSLLVGFTCGTSVGFVLAMWRLQR